MKELQSMKYRRRLAIYPLRCDEITRLPECLNFQLSEPFSQSGSSLFGEGGQLISFLWYISKQEPSLHATLYSLQPNIVDLLILSRL